MTTENELRKIENDLIDIIDSTISVTDLSAQVERFKTGFPATHLDRACIIGDGIYRIKSKERDELLGIFEEAASQGRFSKFVPASGAATRMFKHLISKLNVEKDGGELEANDSLLVDDFMECLPMMPFYGSLKKVMAENGYDLEKCFDNAEYSTILEYLLTDKGLRFVEMPKGLIPFHSYDDSYRTSFEEHLAESLEYIKCRKNKVKIHFTVSPDHKEAISTHINESIAKFSGKKFDITFSEQSKKTDTVAVDMDNEIFRTFDNKILFRPAGHGALLGNLQRMGGDLVYLKNVDNVVPDSKKGPTIEYKKLLGGLLVQLQDQIFECINMLENHNCSEFEVAVVSLFAVSRLNLHLPINFTQLSIQERVDFLLKHISRPVRVCGMVKNQGEPGGGPFWVKGSDGFASPQIVEKSQVDMTDSDQEEILKTATHFNPVDLVCGVRNYKGERFNLMKFMDPETGFISTKSKDGRMLKAMELPGLWNGSMAKWITVFVEVPLSTFSPVKTVNDLLKREHQESVC
ncbi:DUF4301 family protein [Maridesulfovibrio zosterae]|uniref:DUF4301 family protein n=1 Tax=Maridesulfovibrio zosterae TaxID=82171 RepID=UPI00040F4163|nr:DUF4301 family protein [Maridesulfovibrio zosterae]